MAIAARVAPTASAVVASPPVRGPPSPGGIASAARTPRRCTADVRLPESASISSGSSTTRPEASVGTMKNIRPPSAVAAPVTIVSTASPPVTHGQTPSSRQPPSVAVATRAGAAACCRLVVSCEIPTVVRLSPRASAGRCAARTADGPAAMILTALAHWVRASAVVRQHSAKAPSISIRAGSPAAVPPQSSGTKPASTP